jgi:hypothetical protein
LRLPALAFLWLYCTPLATLASEGPNPARFAPRAAQQRHQILPTRHHYSDDGIKTGGPSYAKNAYNVHGVRSGFD